MAVISGIGNVLLTILKWILNSIRNTQTGIGGGKNLSASA